MVGGFSGTQRAAGLAVFPHSSERPRGWRGMGVFVFVSYMLNKTRGQESEHVSGESPWLEGRAAALVGK